MDFNAIIEHELSEMVFISPPKDFKPKIEVAACFIEVEGRYLFMKRQPFKSEGGLWGIPGGKLEKGESALQAAHREVEEETGLTFLPEQIVHFKTVYIRYPEIDFVYQMFVTTLTEVPKQLQIDPSEHTEYSWIYLKEALALPLIRGEAACIHLFESGVLSTKGIQ